MSIDPSECSHIAMWAFVFIFKIIIKFLSNLHQKYIFHCLEISVSPVQKINRFKYKGRYKKCFHIIVLLSQHDPGLNHITTFQFK